MKMSVKILAIIVVLSISGAVSGETPFGDDREVILRSSGNSSPVSDPNLAPKGNSLAGKARGFFSKLLNKGADYKDKSLKFLSQGKDLLQKEKNLPGFIRQGTMSDSTKKELLKLAKAHPERAWKPGTDISQSKNAHRTNTLEELKEAFKGTYDWFEVDVRQEGPLRDFLHLSGERRPIASHDTYQTNGILLDDWLDLVKKSGRGIKIDLKDSEALKDVLDLLKKHQIPDGKLILNIGIPDPGPGESSPTNSLRNQPLHDGRLDQIRKAFPQVIINLSPGASSTTEDGLYASRQVDQMIRYAKASGQPVMFPLKAEMVSKEIVQALKPYGKVAIWNDPNSFSPSHVDVEVKKFRSWGVDGMIDIRTNKK